MRVARIGGPIILAAIGAILYFAVPNAVEEVPLGTIGIILMIAGGIWLVLELIMGRPRSSVVSEQRTVNDGGVPRQEVRETRHDEV